MNLSCHRLARAVNLFSEGSQFQRLQAYSFKDKILILFDFYPRPRNFALLWCREEGLCAVENFFEETGWIKVTPPLSQYLKAHLVNQRVARVWEEGGALHVEFAVSQHRLSFFDIEKTGQMRVAVDRRSGSPFACILKIPQQQNLLFKSVETQRENALKKFNKLLKNVEGDFAQAERNSEVVESLITQLSANPQAWGEHSQFSELQIKAIENFVQQKRLPPFVLGTVGKALSDFYKLKSRLDRKLLKSQARLQELKENQERIVAGYVSKATRQSNDKGHKKIGPQLKPQKKPGLWLQNPQGLWVRVGKSAKENAVILQQAKSNDLWFHVRGFAGSHVWVPRGQPGFATKEKLSHEILEWIAKIALKYSKAKAASFAAVDYTEKKYLRKIKGGPEGLVTILKSKTIEIRNLD